MDKKKKFPKTCYYCKYLDCKDRHKFGLNGFCEKFKFCATCKSI